MYMNSILTTLSYGGDYNPDQWDESIWLEDARLMQEAGVNLVSLGIFSWAKLEPASGQFDFGWLDRVIDLLHAHGVRVNLATPTASPPPWLVAAHPEILPVTMDGVRLWHGSRRHYCPNSPVYREHAARIATQLAERYGAHPALVMWHIDNEYGCHVTECFCDICAAAFRVWLQARYEALELLNQAWGTAFWSQHYGAWDEVFPPRRAPTFPNPSQQLDWKRFCSDSFLSCFWEQKVLLRALTPNLPQTTNFMRFFKPLDYWKWAAAEDIVSNDSYPDPSDPEWMVESAMACDLMRSLKGGAAWFLMEQAPTHVNWREHNVTKRPGEMRLGSYQAVARGANAVLFFQWRASKAGSEKFHSGMVPHAGMETRVWREVSALGNELQQLDALASSRVSAKVAFVFDWDNWWALELESKPSDLQLFPRVLALYREFYRRNITVDFARPDADLSQYSLVIAPHLYLVTDAAVENINRYVAQGGTLLMNFFSGIVDENEHIRLGGYPAPFRDLLGLWIEEFAAQADGQTNRILTGEGESFATAFWVEVIHPTTAEVLARFGEDYVAGQPAVTRHAFEKGVSYYLGTELDPTGLTWLLDRVCADAKIESHLAPSGVEIVSRADAKNQWMFLLNYSDIGLDVPVPPGSTDWFQERLIEGLVHLGPMELAILHREG